MTPPQQTDATADVVIVGGGIAGITCAVGLRDRGLRVVLLERGERLGGRAQSWTDAKTGDPVHIGPHIFLSQYPNMLALLDVLGTRDKIVWQSGKFITIFEGERPITMKMAPLPAPFHFVPSIVMDRTVAHRDKLSNVPVTLFAMQLTEEDFLRLDAINAAAFLRSMGVTQRYMDRFWAFASMSIMNVPLELCSAGALLRFYARMVGHAHYDVGFPDGGLGDVFAPRAKELLEAAGVRVLLGAGVRRFTGDAGRVTGVELDDGSRIEAPACVAALPPQALRRVAHPSWLERHDGLRNLSAFQPCPYVSVFLWFDRKLTDMKFWARVHAPEDLNCDFYDLSNIHTGWAARPSLITSNIIYSHRTDGMSDDEIVERTRQEIAETLREAARATIVHRVVNRIPMAIHCPYPGTERLRPKPASSVRGLTLAGDWIRTSLPSSMESAAMSGWLAAEEILRARGVHARLALEHPGTEGLSGAMRRASRWLPVKRIPMWTRGIRTAD